MDTMFLSPWKKAKNSVGEGAFLQIHRLTQPSFLRAYLKLKIKYHRKEKIAFGKFLNYNLS